MGSERSAMVGFYEYGPNVPKFETSSGNMASIWFIQLDRNFTFWEDKASNDNGSSKIPKKPSLSPENPPGGNMAFK